jgi:L-lysine 2,3-aminomutase
MIQPRKIKFYNLHSLESIPQVQRIAPEDRFAMQVVGHVLPFRTNNYVVEELIDWDRVPDDPMFQLTFPQRGMLHPDHFERMAQLLESGASREEREEAADEIRFDLNPHPAGQRTANVPWMDDEPVPGVQHKYRETCLVFPSSGQTCHAYCTFCFRWPQFVGIDDLKFATDESRRFQEYIRRHREVSDVLLTGGDPMVMSAKKLAGYVEPFLGAGFEHVRTIRIGTKSVAYWPYRYVSDHDAEDVLRLFEKVVKAGKHLAIMGHHSHWVELTTEVAREAICRIRSTGAQYRTQSPVLAHINDSADVWARMWQMQIELGCVPYYMFIERNTGARDYFAIPLHRALEIYREAYSRVSGLARTVRGPSMSAFPGKVRVDGVAEIQGEVCFVLSFVQGRDGDWVKRPFFAQFDPGATWLDDLRPAFGEEKFFFEDRLAEIVHRRRTRMPLWPGRRSGGGHGDNHGDGRLHDRWRAETPRRQGESSRRS